MPLTVNFSVKKTHLIQTLVQLSLLAYWCVHFQGIREYLPFIAAQLVYAFMLSVAVTWFREKKVDINLAFVPIVLSINFFVHFKPQFFFFQLLLVAFAVLSKSIKFAEGGKHVFNPSGIAVFITALILVLTGKPDLVYGSDFIQSFMLVPHFHVLVFTLGCVTLWYAGTFGVAIGALLSLSGLYYLSKLIVGLPPTPYMVHESVFLAITLLATDPATSPKTGLGQWIYGMVYGASIILAFGILSFLNRPEYYDKILFLPLLNYFRQHFDRVSWKKTVLTFFENKKKVFAVHAVLGLALLPLIQANFGSKSVFRTFIKSPFKRVAATELNQDLQRQLALYWKGRCKDNADMVICSKQMRAFDFDKW